MNDEDRSWASRPTFWVSAVLAAILLVSLTMWVVSLRQNDDVVPEGRFDPVAGSSYSGVREIFDKMRAAKIPCDGLSVSGEEQTEEVGAEFGFCQVGAQTVNIHVYEDPQEVLRHVNGNFSVRDEDNPNYFTSGVYGTNWVVDTYSVATSLDVRQALGGRLY